MTDQKVAAANAALARARVIGALHAAGEPVMGPSLLTAAQMVAWYNAQGYHPRLETSINDLAQIFIDEGTDENVRGDFAFAQSIVETAGFNAAPANNYSGIGWCDSCSTGNRFPNPREGVRAQIQLLLNYADAGRTRRQPPSPGVAVSLRFGSRCRGAEVRQLLRQGLGADLERHGPRQLGNRSELRRSGDRRVQPDGGVLAGRLAAHASAVRAVVELGEREVDDLVVRHGGASCPRGRRIRSGSSVSRTRVMVCLAAGELLAVRPGARAAGRHRLSTCLRAPATNSSVASAERVGHLEQHEAEVGGVAHVARVQDRFPHGRPCTREIAQTAPESAPRPPSAVPSAPSTAPARLSAMLSSTAASATSGWFSHSRPGQR